MKTLIAFVMALNVLFMVSAAGAVVIMDATHHNGSLTYDGAAAPMGGFWALTPAAIPAEWVATAGYLYSSSYTGRGKGMIQAGTGAQAVNNTGELVEANAMYTVSADLGMPGAHPWVRVWATQNADGTGTEALLASVDRIFPTGPADYNVYTTVGAQGAPAAACLDGYFIQVEIGGTTVDDGGYYDNIVVTATPEPATLLLLGLGGMMVRRRTQH